MITVVYTGLETLRDALSERQKFLELTASLFILAALIEVKL